MKIPDSNEAIQLLKNNTPIVEQKFLQWAREHHKQTGKFADEKEAEEAVVNIMINYVFEELGDPSLPGPVKEIAKKSLTRALKMAGILDIKVQVVPSSSGDLRCQIGLEKD